MLENPVDIVPSEKTRSYFSVAEIRYSDRSYVRTGFEQQLYILQRNETSNEPSVGLLT